MHDFEIAVNVAPLRVKSIGCLLIFLWFLGVCDGFDDNDTRHSSRVDGVVSDAKWHDEAHLSYNVMVQGEWHNVSIDVENRTRTDLGVAKDVVAQDLLHEYAAREMTFYTWMDSIQKAIRAGANSSSRIGYVESDWLRFLEGGQNENILKGRYLLERNKLHPPYCSPNGKGVLLVANRRSQSKRNYLTLPFANPLVGEPYPELVLLYYEFKTNKLVQLAKIPENCECQFIHWCPDNARVRFLSVDRSKSCCQLLELDLASRVSRVVFEERSESFVDTCAKTWMVYLDRSDEILWTSEREGNCGLFLINAKNGETVSRIGSKDRVFLGISYISSDEKTIWFAEGGIKAQNPYNRHLFKADLKTFETVSLSEGDGTHTALPSPSRKYLVDCYSRVDSPPVYNLIDSESGKLVMELEKANCDGLLKQGWRMPEPFVSKGRDGTTDIYGVIMRPTNAKRTYPVIEHIYASPQGSNVPCWFGISKENQAFLDSGFIVVVIDGMGTSHRSKEFHNKAWKNLADGGFPDRKIWINSAASIYKEMDISNLVIFGRSHGGRNAARALISHNDLYKVAISLNGIHNELLSGQYWTEQWMGWPVETHYLEQSNVSNAHELKGSILLLVGLDDKVGTPSEFA